MEGLFRGRVALVPRQEASERDAANEDKDNSCAHQSAVEEALVLFGGA